MHASASGAFVLLLALAATACGTSGSPSGSEIVLESSTPARSAAPIPTVTATPVAPTATPAPTPTAVATPTPEPTCLERLPLRVALGQLLLPLASPDQFSEIVELALTGEVSGAVILGSPTVAQLTELTENAASAIPLVLGSDEEGGRVQRLSGLLGPLPSAAELAQQPAGEVEAMFAAYGGEMSDLGLAMAFAPVVDVGSGPGIEERSFSPDPDVVTAYGQAVVDGYVAGGVVPVLKHFPGHGRAAADSHLGLSTTPPLDQLRTTDLLPFVELMSTDVAVMVGHLLVPGLTEDLPASLSPDAIDGLLRDELGFDGLVITDSLGMNAVSDRWDNAEAGLLALVAGADLLIVEAPDQVKPVLDHLEASVADGSLSRAQVDDSVERVLALKAADPCALS